MAANIPSSIIDIVKAIKAQLVRVGQFQPSQIYITSRRAIPHFIGDKDCVLRVNGERPNEATLQGGGGLNDQKARSLTIVIRTRLAVDVAGTDTRHLLNEDTGHLSVEDDVFNALELFWPIDVSSNTITNYPIRLGPLTETESEKEPEWLASSVTVEISYTRKLSPNQLR